MTREETKKMLPVIIAYAEGKVIQFRSQGIDIWHDVRSDSNHEINIHEYNYRIKSSPKYRPFKDAEECWNEMLKHQPFGWVKEVNGDITCLGFIRTDEVQALGFAISYNEAFKQFHFADGAVFGVREMED